jgi:hypothetical protein
MFSSMFRASLMAGALALSVMSTAALAEPVIPFTVNPGVIGAPQGSFTASYMDFSYVALVDQVAAGGVGTFTEEGAGFFSSFRHPDLATVVSNTGINQDYKIYGVFTGAGTVAPTVTGGLTATFTDFNLRLFADPQMNTTIIADGTGPPNGTVSIGGTIADDILIGQSAGLISGEAHVFPGLANGDFAVLVNFQPIGGFLSGITQLAIGEFNGVNTSLQGFSQGTFVDGRIDGSGNFSIVPEPSSLLLLGSGLAALGWFNRKPRR